MLKKFFSPSNVTTSSTTARTETETVRTTVTERETKIASPPSISNLPAIIGYLCASPQLSTSIILSLADYTTSSTTKSIVIIKLLRKELVYAVNDLPKQNALILLLLLSRYSTSFTFKQSLAKDKKMKQVLLDFASTTKDSTLVSLHLRVMADLAYEYQSDPSLSSITALYNSIRPTTGDSWSLNGQPLSDDDPILSLQSGVGPTIYAPPQLQQPQSSLRRNLPTEVEQLEDLTRVIDQAGGLATVLVEAIEFTEANLVQHDPIINEFHQKCLSSQQRMLSNLDWVEVQARNSGAVIAASTTTTGPNHDAPSPNSTRLSSNNPFAAIIAATDSPLVDVSEPLSTPESKIGETQETTEQVETLAELTLARLLAVNQEILNALQLYSDRIALAQHEVELQLSAERSLVDKKTVPTSTLSRLELPTPSFTSPQASASSSTSLTSLPSVNEKSVSEDETERLKTREENYKMSNSSNPYAAHLRNPIRSDPNLSPSIPTASPSVVSSPALPISTSSSSVELPILQISTMDLNSSSDGGVDWVIQEDGEESPRSSAIPIRPSEKALGKLRKFSVREGEDSPDVRQQALETQLNAKYAQNLRDVEKRKEQKRNGEI